MSRGLVNGWTRRRLRLAMVMFFIALALPTGVLVNHAFGQLKWEAFHQHQALADELVRRIDTRLAALVRAEEARPFSDYAFADAAGTSGSGPLQRSPLAVWPVAATVPGLVGHFQVDPGGRLSSPLLPATGAGDVGLEPAERRFRAVRVQTIEEVLARNSLVPSRAGPAGLETAAPEPAALQANAVADEAEGGQARERAASTESRQSVPIGSAGAPPAPAPETIGSQVDSDRLEQLPGAQAAFDRLSSLFSTQRKDAGAGIGRVEDLELAQPYAEQALPSAEALAEREAIAPERARVRAESSKSATRAQAVPSPAAPTEHAAITAFESELDPFEFSLLGSEHLVLFRKVWRDGERYIQGLLLDQPVFLAESFERPFRATTLALTTRLAVAWRGEVLVAYRGQTQRGYLASAEEMQGALLRRARLSAPLSELELVVSVGRLPIGPGAGVLGWSAGVLALVLAAGCLLFYRAGCRQIDLSQQQQDFVAAVSHELKTPLTSIRMYGEMLREGWVVDEQRRRGYYDYIVDESERLSRLIGNVLQLARMTRGGVVASLQPVAVETLAERCREKIAAQVQRAGYELDILVDETVRERRVQVDEDFVSQILINLVDNALKFSRHAERKAVEVAFRAGRGDSVVLAVRDHGPGVPRRQMKRIFRLFYRVGSELTRETAGTGIGLALVRELARAMGAGVDVVNREPGAEFRVQLKEANAREVATA